MRDLMPYAKGVSAKSRQFNKEGEECFSFGKHKGKRVVDVMEQEPGYFGWLLNADFPLYTKKVLTAIKLRQFNNKLS